MDCLQVGCSDAEIHVPLFTELYGYGPFLGRRNRGVRDPLCCRVASFRCGDDRLIVVTNDLVTIDPDAAWAVRSEMGRRLHMPATNIMITGTHTHSGPTISPGIGWGELDPAFRDGWIRVAVEQALRAAADESPVHVTAGTCPLLETLGTNRISKGGPTDPDIRWIRFTRPDGSVKLLLHNHGMHGVVFGKDMLLVSADWPGAVNDLALREGLADNVLFLQGAAGNVNTEPCCLGLEAGEPHLTRIADSYVGSLKQGLTAGGHAMDPLPLRSVLAPTPLPCEPVTPEGLREAADALRGTAIRPYLPDRLEEMALHLEAGNDVDVVADLQAMRIGGIYIYAFPGEPFVELGTEIMAKSPGEMALVAEVANGNCRYFPTPEVFARHPDIRRPSGYGFYEIHQGCGRFMPTYRSDIAPFLIQRFLDLAARLETRR